LGSIFVRGGFGSGSGQGSRPAVKPGDEQAVGALIEVLNGDILREFHMAEADTRRAGHVYSY